MPTSNTKGLKGIAAAAGLKRRFFGFESDRSFASRVVRALESQSPVLQLLDGLSKAFEPRHCISEERIVHHVWGKQQNEWIYHYSDGTWESVKGPWERNRCT